MKFTKMQGIGNDYIYFNCFEETIENPEELSRRLSDRRFGIGGDGICLIKPSDRADAFMDLYNADGSRAMMCGNGIRCVGKYVYERGICRRDVLKIDTLSGVKTLYLTVENGIVTAVKVNMSAPILEPAKIPTTLPSNLKQKIQANGTEYEVTAVSMGNPHSVIFTNEVDTLDLEKIGPALENHPSRALRGQYRICAGPRAPRSTHARMGTGFGGNLGLWYGRLCHRGGLCAQWKNGTGCDRPPARGRSVHRLG